MQLFLNVLVFNVWLPKKGKKAKNEVCGGECQLFNIYILIYIYMLMHVLYIYMPWYIYICRVIYIYMCRVIYIYMLCYMACRSSFPQAGIEPRLWQWKLRILTNRPPENSLVESTLSPFKFTQKPVQSERERLAIMGGGAITMTVCLLVCASVIRSSNQITGPWYLEDRVLFVHTGSWKL